MIRKKHGCFSLTILISSFLVSTNAWSSLSIKMDCPQKFHGLVSEIVEPEGPLHSLSKTTFIFDVVKNVRGEKEKRTKVQILKYSDLKLEKGKTYAVDMHGQYICSVTEVI
jgi:hypothetical protein